MRAVLGARFLGDLDVGAVQGTYGDGAVPGAIFMLPVPDAS